MYKCVISARVSLAARCEKVGKYVLPMFRSLIAEELVRTYGLTQVEAAKRLGTTQAAISQYLNSKRAFKSSQQFVDVIPRIRAIANQTARRLANNEMKADEIAMEVCKLCSVLGDQEQLTQTADYYNI
jgi:predicted transcriptional regulator